MSLLRDYVITPDVFVFNKDVYESEEIYDLYMEKIFDVISNRGVIRNLRAGKWGKEINRNLHRYTDRTRRRIRSLKGRDFPFAPAPGKAPTKAEDWIKEAFKTHREMGFTGGIITTAKPTTDDYRTGPIKCVHDLRSHPDESNDTDWWPNYGDSSICLERTTASYKENLSSILHYSTSLKFIDPYINLEERESFIDTLLGDVLGNADRHRSLKIQIHSSIKAIRESGMTAEKLETRTKKYMECSCNKITSMLQNPKVKEVEVFVWRDFHDRYLMSDLIGVSLAHGFSTAKQSSLKTTWGRLSRDSRLYVQKAFDPKEKYHEFIDGFAITQHCGRIVRSAIRPCTSRDES